MSSDPSFTVRQYEAICNCLPDPAFILTETGRYVAILGGRDKRYYHDGSSLVGKNIAEVVVPAKAEWFVRQIRSTLAARQMQVVEYELSVHDVLGVPVDGPAEPIWFEGRLSALPERYGGENAVLWVASNITDRKRLERQLQEQALTDELTGLPNRRSFMQELSAAFAAFGRYQQPACVISFDLDHFKALNDSLGHPGGDAALRALAREVQQVCRPSDVFCRLGGDEFALVCLQCDAASALLVAERIRAVGRRALEASGAPALSSSLSIGVACIQSADDTVESVLYRVDRALYASKSQGGDRVTASDGSEVMP